MSFKDFVDEIIKEESYKVLGENNHPALSSEGFGDRLVALFFALVRNKREETLKKEVRDVLQENIESIKNLFVLAFQTRWCRGGKGEKQLFYIIFCELYEHYPKLCLELLELIPQYGYWKDFRNIHYYYFTNHMPNPDTTMFIKMLDIIEKQLKLDIYEMENNIDKVPKISLLAKYYSPKKCFCKDNKISKRSSIDNLFFESLAKRLYITQEEPDKSTINYAEMTLRKKLVSLRKLLDIPEVKMCANRWAEINFNKVASLCMSRNSRAFLDEDKSGNLRHPDNEDRKLCRQHLIDTLSKGIKGSQLMPNELVEKVYGNKVSPGMEAVANSQWNDLFENLKEQIKKRAIETGNNNFDLTRCLVMSDVSGSMSGTPMMVSIAFGILVSQLSHDSFKDLVLTFDDEPEFHSLKNADTFSKKVESLSKAKWGGTTNFEGAMKLIIKIIEKNKLKEEEIPQSLLVVSDMQFNAALDNSDYHSDRRGSGWGTAYDNIKNMFNKLGERLYGHNINPPQIIFWNVRADTVGFPCASDDEGVTMLSGYSAALLKFIFSGELEEEVEVVDESGRVRKVKVRLNPKETLAKILGESALNPVREVVEKYFADNL